MEEERKPAPEEIEEALRELARIIVETYLREHPLPEIKEKSGD